MRAVVSNSWCVLGLCLFLGSGCGDTSGSTGGSGGDGGSAAVGGSGGASGAGGAGGAGGQASTGGGPLSACGDGVVDAGEACDDGTNDGGEGECLPGCTALQSCGNGTIEGTESCDDGTNDGGEGECLPGCVALQTCGDGNVEGTETCDDGTNDGGEGECLPGCAGLQSCGDGSTEGTEICDDGVNDGSGPLGCTVGCGAPATCGNGTLEAPEMCDDGQNDGGEGECLPGCIGFQLCGDDVANGTETCDGDRVSCLTLGGGFGGGEAGCNGACTGYDDSSCTLPTCTVLYDLNATFQITNTPFSAGDQTNTGLDGLLVLEYTEDGSGNIIDGPVNVLHYWTYNDFVVGGLVTVTTKVHGFSPSCNGETNPSWRIDTDPGFPLVCNYQGNTTPVASGTFDVDADAIEWDACNAAADYWSSEASGNSSYEADDLSSGSGCLNGLVSTGNVACSGGLCGLGGLIDGNNPQFATWTQPFINGTGPSATNGLDVSSDAQATTVSTRTGASGGFQSHNVPNDTSSRTWVSWTGTRNGGSQYTTCN
ncbi:MAG: hypothetical protein AAF500_03955 [Myxococcota bacterium]